MDDTQIVLKKKLPFPLLKLAMCILLGVVFTSLFVLTEFGRSILRSYGIVRGSVITLVIGAVFVAVSFVLPVVIARMREVLALALSSNNRIVTGITHGYDRVFSGKHGIIITFVLCFSSFIPTILAFYPGIFGNDGPVEFIFVVDSNTPLTAHHPLIHVAMVAGSILLGRYAFGSDTTGLLIYSIVQTLIVTAGITYILYWLRKHNVSRVFRVVAALFLVVNPITQALAIHTTKDTIFSVLFVVTALKLLDLLQTPQDQLTWSQYVGFFIIAVLMSLFRKQGYYLLAAVLVAVLIFFFKKFKVSVLLFVTVLVSWFMMGPFISILGIPQGDAREMYNVPIQQVAAVWNADRNGLIHLDKNAKQEIERIVPLENLADFHPDNVDFVKYHFDTGYFNKNRNEYIRLYLSLARQYPQYYVASFADLASGYWDFGQRDHFLGLLFLNTYTENLKPFTQIAYKSYLPRYQAFLIKASGDWKWTIANSQALPTWILCAVFAAAIRRKRKDVSIVLLFFTAQLGIVLLGPAMLLRYAYPLMMSIPVMLYIYFYCGSECSHNRSDTSLMK